MLLYLFYSLSIFLALLYVSILLFVIYHWKKCITETKSFDSKPTASFSIVIVARNEEDNITRCIRSILDNDYPESLFEIIVVDDHSVDGTLDLVRAFAQCKTLELKDHLLGRETNGFKKEAIQYAVKNASNEIIVCTDADTIVNKHWLKSISKKFVDQKLDFLTGPILFAPLKNTFSYFENLDILGMMGVTAAGIQSKKWFMANGANMAFRKSIFLELKPYAQSKKYASGDDIFLINAFKKANKEIGFNLETAGTVLTTATASLIPFYNQRIRWATKNKTSDSLTYLFIMVVPFLFCWSIITSALLIPFFGKNALLIFLLLLTLKWIVDFYYLNGLAHYFDQKSSIKNFVPSAVIHILYIAFIGLLSLFVRKYAWKGRKLN